jgi:hypothetical protein
MPFAGAAIAALTCGPTVMAAEPIDLATAKAIVANGGAASVSSDGLAAGL